MDHHAATCSAAHDDPAIVCNAELTHATAIAMHMMVERRTGSAADVRADAVQRILEAAGHSSCAIVDAIDRTYRSDLITVGPRIAARDLLDDALDRADGTCDRASLRGRVRVG